MDKPPRSACINKPELSLFLKQPIWNGCQSPVLTMARLDYAVVDLPSTSHSSSAGSRTAYCPVFSSGTITSKWRLCASSIKALNER